MALTSSSLLIPLRPGMSSFCARFRSSALLLSRRSAVFRAPPADLAGFFADEAVLFFALDALLLLALDDLLAVVRGFLLADFRGAAVDPAEASSSSVWPCRR